MPRIEMLNVDCIEYMKTLKDNEFDLACCDPPFGIFGKKKSCPMNWSKISSKEGSGGTWASKYGKKAKSWDVAPDDFYFTELRRVSENQIIWGANHFGIATDNFIVWRKLTISESFTMGMCEFASVSNPGNPKVFSFQPQDKNRFHPTQKPVALYKWIFANYAKPGQRILDTHGGSFSSAIAAHYAGLEFVGCELDKEYYDAAVERFERETRQVDFITELGTV